MSKFSGTSFLRKTNSARTLHNVAKCLVPLFGAICRYFNFQTQLQEWWQVGTRLVPDWYQIDRFGLDISHHGGGCRTRSTAINHTLPHASIYDRCGTAVHLAWVPLFQHIIAFLLSMSVSHARMMGLLFQFPDTTHLLGSPGGELILATPKQNKSLIWDNIG